MRHILAVDVGTSSLKLGLFSQELELLQESTWTYDVNLYGGGFADIDPERWWSRFVEGCHSLGDMASDVGVISFSVTTPGLVPMAENGMALGPAILFFDGRSHQQAAWIQRQVGERKLLAETCNLPVSGGSSLASMLWIRENQPSTFRDTYKFGHCNTFMVHRLTGKWVVDPSTTSITGLYNTAKNDLSWNRDVLRATGIGEEQLPSLMHSFNSPGCVLPTIASALGVPRDCRVLCGGNDAVLAALSGGLTEPGMISNINGTCEITCVCVDRPVSSPSFNLRCHVIPGLWVTFFVLNTGGKSLEWFRSVFCSEMSTAQFYDEYVPSALEEHFSHEDLALAEASLPDFVPYLQGSRYSLDQLAASLTKVRLETTREMVLLAIIRGNEQYHAAHLREVASLVKIDSHIASSGGVSRIRGYQMAQKRWLAPLEYSYQDQSSLLGAAMLGRVDENGEFPY